MAEFEPTVASWDVQVVPVNVFSKSTASSLGLVMHSDRCVLLIAVNWPLSYDHSQGDEDLHDIKNLLEKTKISGTPCNKLFD